MKKKIDRSYLLSLILALALALTLGGIIMALAGHNPFRAYAELAKGATGLKSFGEIGKIFTRRQFGNTIEYAMVLYMTGLACAIGARVGIFNVGGEGQLYLGAIVSAYLGVVLTDLPALIVIPVAALGAMLVGGFYAFIPGF